MWWLFLKITTSGILSFEDCERALRPDMRKELFGFLPVEKEKLYCVILLSEIPLNVNEYVVEDFKVVPITKEKQFFKPYGLLLYVPLGFDFLTAPLFAEAIAPILSFSLRRRIKAHRQAFPAENPPRILREDVNIRLASVSVGPEMMLQQELTKGEQARRLKSFAEIYRKLMKVSRKDFLAILRAFRLYQLSLLSYREDIGLAYALQVAAAESVANHFPQLQFSFADLPDAEDWQKVFDSLGIPESSAEVIKNKVLKNTLFLSIKFRRFIEQFLPDSFWVSADSRAAELDEYINELQREHFGSGFGEEKSHFKRHRWLYTPERKVTKGELDSVLKNIYDLRSHFAHSGMSPPFEVSDTFETAEIRIEVDSRNRVKYRRAIPSYFWFERVVHDSILNLVNSL